MIIQDDRTDTTFKTHTCLIAATDRYMSGWGGASGGKSYAVWACKPEHARKVLDWVESRSEMKFVRVVMPDYRPKGKGHCHIYVVGDNHASLGS